MALFFFQLRDDDDLLDPEGIELPDLEAARATALAAARDTLSHDIKRGEIDLRYRIDVEDEAGRILHSVSMREAFAVIE